MQNDIPMTPLFSFEGAPHVFPVAMAEGSHPFPSRTRQLSPPALMVLGTQVPGRVGRRRN